MFASASRILCCRFIICSGRYANASCYWAKDGGKYDFAKTVGSNLVGSVIEAKLGNSFATPYLREASTNAFDKVYDTLGKENNEKK